MTGTSTGLPLFSRTCGRAAPIYDTTGLTALTAANLVYEMLCVLPGVEYRYWDWAPGSASRSLHARQIEASVRVVLGP